MFNAQINDLLGMRHVHMEIDPKRRIGGRFDVENALLNFLGRHDSTSKEPETTGISRRGHKARVSHPPHRGLNDGIAATQQLGQSRVHDRSHNLSGITLSKP